MSTSSRSVATNLATTSPGESSSSGGSNTSAIINYDASVMILLHKNSD